jgi:hypothetical protein
MPEPQRSLQQPIRYIYEFRRLHGVISYVATLKAYVNIFSLVVSSEIGMYTDSILALHIQIFK